LLLFSIVNDVDMDKVVILLLLLAVMGMGAVDARNPTDDKFNNRCVDSVTAYQGSQVQDFECDRAWLGTYVQWNADWNIDVQLESLDPGHPETRVWTNSKRGVSDDYCGRVYMRPPVRLTMRALPNVTYEVGVKLNCVHMLAWQVILTTAGGILAAVVLLACCCICGCCR